LFVAIPVAAFVVTLCLISRPERFPYQAALTFSDPSMNLIGVMVERGDLWGASARVGNSFRFDQPKGLMALRRFSILVLQRGLEDYDAYERCYVTSALAAAGDRNEVAQLVRIFQATQKPGLKMAAVDGLGDVGNADAVGALERLYYGSQSSSLRIVVIGAAETRNSGAVDLLSRALSASDRATRLAAAKGLGQLGSHSAIGVLRRYLAATHDPYERATAAYSLLRLGDRLAEDIAETILGSRVDDYARATAALALGRARDPQLVAELRPRLVDHNLDVRIAVAVALTRYGDPAGAAYLRAAMRDGDWFTRLEVGQLLDEVEFSNAREIVMAAVTSPDRDLSLQGIRAIGISGDTREIDFLAHVADEATDPVVRAEAAWALGRIGGTDAVAPLIAMVSDPDHSVRYTAADALDRTALRLLEGGVSSGA
jgi:HEAT repeat protein